MIELPEAHVLAEQIQAKLTGKAIADCVAASSPHKFAWYYGDPAEYGARLKGKRIDGAAALGGRVEVYAGGMTLSLNDGANPRYYSADEKVPDKHQLFISFEDGSACAVTIAMYGGLLCYPDGALDDDSYRKASAEAVSPLSEGFEAAFDALFSEKSLKMSAKAFLATEQRIPGLGNGVLHDILLNARIHPKRKMSTLSAAERSDMLDSIRTTLSDMTRLGGRDTERDLFNNPGSYKTKLSRNNQALLCPDCGGHVHKEAYLGGSIYYCESCQIL